MPALKDFISLSLAIARRIENPTLTTRDVRNVALVESSKVPHGYSDSSSAVRFHRAIWRQQGSGAFSFISYHTLLGAI